MMTGIMTDDMRLVFDMIIRNPEDHAREKAAKFTIDTSVLVCMVLLQEDVDELGLRTDGVLRPATHISGMQGASMVYSVGGLTGDAEWRGWAIIGPYRTVGTQFLLGNTIKIGFPGKSFEIIDPRMPAKEPKI